MFTTLGFVALLAVGFVLGALIAIGAWSGAFFLAAWAAFVEQQSTIVPTKTSIAHNNTAMATA